MKFGYKSFITVLILVLLISGCKKDEDRLPPVISFKVGSDYTQNNAVVQVGHRLYFGIQARGNNTNITNLTVKKVLENHTTITMMDTGMNTASIDLNKVFYQNVEPKATWIFSVMDRNRMKAEISLVVYTDSNSTYGGIYYFPSIKMGYQLNTAYGHFLDLSTGKVYNEDTATLFQDKIEILTYFVIDGTPVPVLSSPGEMDNYSTDAKTYYPCIVSWTTRKYTLWDISVDDTPVPVTAFDDAQNDSLLIVSYHDVWGKKKFKWATAGRIIPFLTASGKKGLIKVINAGLSDTGAIEFAIKIQQ